MREALSKRPKTTSKPTTKAKVAENRAKVKLRSKPKAQNLSASKTTARSTAKTKPAAVKQAKSTKKVPAKKKVVAKAVKPASKRTVKAAPKATTQKALPAKTTSKRNSSTIKAKIKETKAKAPTKARAKTPVSAKTSKLTGKTTQRLRPSKVETKSRRKIVSPIKIAPPPEPPRRAVPSGALRAFEHAVRVFNRRHFEDAKIMFENLLTKFPSETEIIARTQMYLQVCKQKLSHAQIMPRNADELYDRGVYALNLGDFSQAKNFFEKALRLKPDEPHLLYSLAAAHAQTGSMDQALDYLRRTIQLQPRYRTQALNDSDFSDLRENKQFLELLGLASPFDLLPSRR